MYAYHGKNHTTHIYDKTIQNELLIGELGYSDHTTITYWLTKIRHRYFDKNGEMQIEKVIADGEQLTAKQNESIEKRNRMVKQWVRSNDANLTDNQTDNLTIKVQSE